MAIDIKNLNVEDGLVLANNTVELANHYIHQSFTMIENASPQYILLCRNLENNNVNGRIQINRTSGNYQASNLDIVVTSGASIGMQGGSLVSNQVYQQSIPGEEKYDLVTLTRASDSTSWVAVRYVGNTFPNSVATFTGYLLSSSSGFLTTLTAADVNSVVLFNTKSKVNFASSNVEIQENRILTIADEGSGNGLDADTLDGYHFDDAVRYGHIYGKAQSGITKGQAVQFAGVQGDHILVKAAVPSEINTNPDYFIGIARDTLNTNDFGYFLTFGELVGTTGAPLDTATNFDVGDILWFASAGSTAGALTKTEPTGTNAKIQVAAVTKENATEGILLVRVNRIGTDVVDIKASGTPSISTFLRGDGQWVENPSLRFIGTIGSSSITAESLYDTAQTYVTNNGGSLEGCFFQVQIASVTITGGNDINNAVSHTFSYGPVAGVGEEGDNVFDTVTLELGDWIIIGKPWTYITDQQQWIIVNNSDDKWISGGTMTGNLTIEANNPVLTVNGADTGTAMIKVNGDSQGTGAIEVAQSTTYGGGMSYNGDGSPAFVSGESADHITFYRLDNGTRSEVFHYPYNSDVVNFNATPTVSGTSVSLVGHQHTIANITDLQTSLDAKANLSPTTDTKTGNYTLAASDAGKVLRINSSSNLTVTVPLNTTAAIEVNAEIAIIRYGTGTVTLSPAVGVTLNSVNTNRRIKDRYGSAALKKIATNEWILVGSLEA